MLLLLLLHHQLPPAPRSSTAASLITSTVVSSNPPLPSLPHPPKTAPPPPRPPRQPTSPYPHPRLLLSATDSTAFAATATLGKPLQTADAATSTSLVCVPRSTGLQFLKPRTGEGDGIRCQDRNDCAAVTSGWQWDDWCKTVDLPTNWWRAWVRTLRWLVQNVRLARQLVESMSVRWLVQNVQLAHQLVETKA